MKLGMTVKDLAPHFQIELERDGRLDKMIVKVEAGPGTNESAV